MTAWARRAPLERICTTAINEAEILVGIAGLPDGRRRDSLAAAAKTLFARYFEGRMLPFDSAASGEFARLISARRRIGRPIQAFDA